MNPNLSLKFSPSVGNPVYVDLEVDEYGKLLELSCKDQEFEKILKNEDKQIELQRLVDSAMVGNIRLGPITIRYHIGPITDYMVTKSVV